MNSLFRQISVVVSFFSFLVWAQPNILVETLDEQTNNPSQITLRLRLTNSSQDTLKNVRLRYFLSLDENRLLVLSPYYLPNASVSTDTINHFLAVNIDIPQVIPGIYPNSSGISLGLRYQDNKDVQKHKHFSYSSTQSFAYSPNISIYANNIYIAGNTPIGDEIPKIRFTGIQPESFGKRPAWVEMENNGPLDISLKGFYLKWSVVDSIALPDTTLLTGQKIRICNTNNIQMCPSDDHIQANDTIDFEKYENFSLVWRKKNIETIPYVPYDIGEISTGGLYIESNSGIFFTMTKEKWVAHHYYDLGYENELPSPEPYNRNLISYGNDHTYHFAWHPVEGGRQYLLTVIDDNDSIIYQQITNQTHIDLVLEGEHYFWGVQNASSGIPTDGSALRSVINSISKIDAEIDSTHILHVLAYKPQKDTRMLVLNWGERILEKGWDHPNESDTLSEEEEWRCWVVAIQMINAYYGGNLTQDEIKFHGKTMKFENFKLGRTYYNRNEKDSILAPFSLNSDGGGQRYETLATLAWALNISSDEIDIRINSVPSMSSVLTDSLVKNFIDAKRPLLVSNGGHAMVVDGYDFHDVNNKKLHFLNVGNDGKAAWWSLNDSIANCVYYFAPPFINNTARHSNALIYQDNDGDGVIDFDEIMRFKTDPNKKDSDNDGIDDKTEIMSYTLREKYSVEGYYLGQISIGSVSINDSTQSIPWWYNRKEVYADIDNDSIRAELDVDSDHNNNEGTVAWDGDEDLNHNGIVDIGETDPYDASDDLIPVEDSIPLTEWDLPENITIYAIDGIDINDRAACHDGERFCLVATESGRLHYSIGIGVDAKIGAISSKGGVSLRNRATVEGNITHYSLPLNLSSTDLQEQAVLYGSILYYNYTDWPYKVSDGSSHHIDSLLGTAVLVVNDGNQVTLNDGDRFRRIRVMRGGKLKVNPGIIYVGDIQLEPGSQLEFLEPGKETIIHAEGNFIWRTTLTNDNKSLVAKGFKLIQYGKQPMYVEGEWAGTIHALNAHLVLGQTIKTLYGRFLGNKVTVHQNTDVYRVDFNPIQSTLEISFK
ncbi:MAG: C10 family peptidase [Fibrobacter sp.]|nr:C10 family peptidase [Fibrobacter sp.]